MNSVYRVNLTTLKTRLESIQNERNSFINYTYKTFLDGYLNYTSEYEIVEMKNTLTTLYNNIQTAYDNIIKWFSNYISDVENLELTMVTRTNKLNSTGTYSYRILSQINPYIMMNKNDVSMAPSVTEKMKQYINKKKEELDVELNKIDDRMAYIEKFGEEVGTEKYNAAIEHINLKSAEYDEELKFLSDEARYAGVIDDPEFIMLQNQIDLFKKTRDDLYIEIQAELANVDLEHGEMSPELQEKIALYQELDYYIVELEKQKEMFPYYSLLSTEEYMLFKQNYDPEKIFASYEDLTTSEGTVDFLTMYEYYKNTLYEGREDLTFDEANQLDVFGSYMITDYMPIEDFYNYTTEEQKELYHFIYATRGEKAARAFADLLVDDINKAKGAELALDFIEEFDEYYASQQSDNALESILGTFATYSTVKIKGLTDGVDSFFDSYLNSNNHHMTADEYARAIIYTHLNEKSDFYAKEYQFNSVVGRIAPMIAVTALTSYVSTPAGVSGGSTISDFVSTGLIFTSSYGDAKHNALVSGYSGSSARLYAFLSGMSEACLERLIGNIPFLSKQSSFTLKGLLSEGFEEAFQEYLDAGYRAILFGEPFDITNLSSDALTAFIYGIMTSGYLNGIETVITVIIDGESHEVDMQELIEKINNTENIDSEQIKTIFAEIKVKIDNPLMNIKVSKEQLNSGIESLAIAHPKYAYKLYSIKEKLSKNSITLDEAVMEYSNIYSDILKNDWYSLETGNFDMNAMNFKSKIAEYENLSHYEIEEDGSYTFYYESVNYDVEGIVRYALANGYDLDADTKELLNKMEELCKNKKSSMSEIKINDYYGSPQYMTENTNAIAEGYSELLNSKYITDDERNELFSKAEEFQTLVNEINELYSVSKDSISKEQYKKMVEKYKRLLELENEMAKINGNAWERYYNNTNAFLCHTFTGEIVSAYDLKDHSVKVCTSLVTDTDGHFAYGNVGIEFRPSIDNVDNFSKDDAGSWDTDEDKFLNNFVYGDGTSCAQFDDNRIVYEAADHSRLIPPESMEAAIKTAGNYTEIVLINNENLVPSSYFYTQNATPEEIAKIKELAIKDGVPLEMINTVTFERIPIPLD